VILSGGLDDGTLGLMDIKRFKGIAIVQEPGEAMFPSMPTSAINNVMVDYILPLDEIGLRLTKLAHEPIPKELGAEFMARYNDQGPDIAEVGNDDLKTENMTGPPSKFTCPECGGALWELENGKVLRYRCHIGHGYTADSLMACQTQRLEDALWTALRALEESGGMRRRMANRARQGGWYVMAENYEEKAKHAEERAGLLRSVLVAEMPRAITAKSAKAIEAKAGRSKDPNAGKAKTRQPRVKVPPGPPKPTELSSNELVRHISPSTSFSRK
jgi:two-component system, chemotaxis family, protein-glutamate methylesterase/glutaminase